MGKRLPMPVTTRKAINKKKANRIASKKTPFPKNIEPMLATLVDKPFDEPGWSYEIKWDGYRAIAYIRNHKVELISRNNKPFNEKFYPIVQELKGWEVNCVLDGEVIVVNDEGLSDFGALQNWRSEADGHLVYYVFDILWNDGISLLDYPLVERRKILQSIVPPEGLIRMSDEVKANGIQLFDVAATMGLEGIIAKKTESRYLPGTRSKEWLKIKTEKRQEAVIGGYTKNENTSKKFSALLMGVYDKGQFTYIGPVGTGFNQKMQQEILDKLAPLTTAKCPFREVPEYNKPSRFRPNPPKAEVTWVKPQIVAEISFRASTKDGALRQPSFKGLREDKKAAQVTFENATQTTEIVKPKDNAISNGIFQKPKSERKSLLNPVDETQVRNVNGHEIKFTNLSKIYWPKEKVSKRDMLNYYYQVAPYMLPYMKDRPQTLNRYPHGINGESFYQKDITGKAPDWIKGFPYYSESDNRQKNFLVCTDEASLMYIASLGCIEMNPWSSRAQSPDNPDWCIIDLDPDTNSFEEVITAARVTKEVLDQLKVPSYCKTSGSSGLHIYIPFSGKHTYEDSKEFARKIVTIVHRQIPSFTSIERLTQKRKGKLYLDFLQNRPQATVASVYSLRPKPGATVSAPLDWEEVKPGLRMKDFNIFNMIDRVKQRGDLFKPVLEKGINLEKTLKAIEAMMK
jgi:bifunctional non-homologous end joining protein LigD